MGKLYTRTPLPYPPKVMKWLQARSNENLVIHYAEELRETRDTGNRPDIPKNARSRMVDLNIMQIKREGMMGYSYVLTPRTKRILEDLEKNGEVKKSE